MCPYVPLHELASSWVRGWVGNVPAPGIHCARCVRLCLCRIYLHACVRVRVFGVWYVWVHVYVQCTCMSWQNSSYFSWACSSAVFAFKRGIRVIVLKRKCLSSILTFWGILGYFWLILAIVRDCTAYGCSNRSNKLEWENLSWHKHHSEHRFCYVARVGSTEHLNMLYFGKIHVWRYVSPYYLLEFTNVAVDHDPNASLSCAFTWKSLNCGLNCNNCYSMTYE